MTRTQFILVASLLPLELLAGCHQKKPLVKVPPPPVLSQPAQPANGQSSTPSTSGNGTTSAGQATGQSGNQGGQQGSQSGNQTGSGKNDQSRAGTSTKPRPRPVHRRKPTPQPSQQNAAAQPPQQPSSPGVPQITIAEGGEAANNGVITTSDPETADAHDRESTAQLLSTTDDNLRAIHRQLSADEQSVVGQIKNYMAQARTAIQDGDPVRAHNLALKAHLLSDSLVK